MNSSRSARRGTGSRNGIVGVDHAPAQLPHFVLDIEPMASFQSPPVCSRKRSSRCPTLPFTTVEDDPDIAPLLKVTAQLFIPVQTAAGHDEEKHVYTLASRSLRI
jgi:hypothetical protein